MENNFRLKDITTHEDDNLRKYTLNFTDGKTQESITLLGKGEVKEPIKL